MRTVCGGGKGGRGRPRGRRESERERALMQWGRRESGQRPPPPAFSSRIPAFGATAETKRCWRRDHTLECAQARPKGRVRAYCACAR